MCVCTRRRENKTYDYNLFEWLGKTWHASDVKITNGNHIIEQNAQNSATQFQDLYTNGGDVIRWTLDHASRNGYDAVQRLRVEIGKPNGEARGINEYINTNIDSNTKAVYRYDGYTGKNGYANDKELIEIAPSVFSDLKN